MTPITQGPLTERDLRQLLGLAGRLPLAWTTSVRRRRLLVLGLASPGFLLVTTTPVHQVFGLLILGLALFAAALLFRARTEPVFERAEAAALWPPSSFREIHHA